MFLEFFFNKMGIHCISIDRLDNLVHILMVMSFHTNLHSLCTQTFTSYTLFKCSSTQRSYSTSENCYYMMVICCGVANILESAQLTQIYISIYIHFTIQKSL